MNWDATESSIPQIEYAMNDALVSSHTCIFLKLAAPDGSRLRTLDRKKADSYIERGIGMFRHLLVFI